MILVHREQTLGDGLVTDGIGQHRNEEGCALIEDGVHREEVGLLGGEVVEPGHQFSGPAHGEEHRRDDHHGDRHQRHQLGEVRQHRGAEARPQRVQQHPDTGDDDAGLERQRRQHRYQRPGGGEVDHQADDAAQQVR